MNILLLDEDAEFRNALSALLKNRGIQVTEGSSGLEGLSHLRQKKFDAVLCDVPGPILEGMPFLAAAIKMSADTPVFILTSSMSLSADEVLSLGAAGYLEKCEIKILELIRRLQGF